MVFKCSDEIGGFDILTNAALIINKPFEEFSFPEYEKQLQVNSTSSHLLSKICAPAMKKNRWGKIVNFTSVTLNGAIYGLTKIVARELGPCGICLKAIAPVAIVSEAEERVFGHKAKEYSNWVLEQQC